MNLSIVNSDLEKIKSKWVIARNFNEKKEAMNLSLNQDEKIKSFAVQEGDYRKESIKKSNETLNSLSGIKKHLLANR